MNNLLNDTKIIILADSIASLMTARIFTFLGAEVYVLNDSNNNIKDFLNKQNKESLYCFLTEDCKLIDLNIKEEANILFNTLEEADIFIYSRSSIHLIEKISEKQSLESRYPQLVIGIETPYGTDGPYNEWHTNEITDFAMGGYMQFCGHPNKEPLMIHGFQAELHSGLQLAFGLISSYWHQLQKNQGTTVEVSRMESMLNAQVWFVPRWLQEGYIWPREPSILIPCKNGHVIWGLQTPEIFLLIEKIDLYEDPKYRTAQGWNQEIGNVKKLLKDWCQQHTKEEIYERAQSLRITITPVNNIVDILSSEQFEHRKWWNKTKYNANSVKVPTAPWKINTVNDASNITKTNNFDESEIALPLKGIKVLEVTNNWAGPHAGRMLADLGADVTLIERNHVQVTRSKHLLGGDHHIAPNFYNRAHTFNQLNRNKKGIVVDLSNAEGKEIFLKLAKETDVIIENNSSRVFPNFGLSFEEIKAHNPTVILCSISGFGATGPQAHHVALGSNLEGSSGLVSTIGYTDNELSESGSFYADPIGGSFGAILSIAALIAQQKNKQAMHIDISLLESVSLFIIDKILMYQSDSKTKMVEANQSDFFVPQGAFQSAGKDCWLALSIENNQQWNQLCKALKNKDLLQYDTVKKRKKNIKLINSTIESWSKKFDHYEATKILQLFNIPSAPILANWEVAADPHLYERNYWLKNVHADAGYQRWDGYPWRISKHWKMRTMPAPRFGQHNQEVLKSIGYTDNNILDFIKSGIISDIPADLHMYIDQI